MNSSIKPLTEYTKNKYQFELVKRVGDAAIFLGRKPTGDANNFEVIRIRKTKGCLRIFPTPENGTREVLFEPKEYAPSDNEWGDLGWTYTTLEAAEAKLQSLTNQNQ